MNSTLMADSCHPHHVLKNIPVGKLIRLKRNCTTEEYFKTVKVEALTRLKQRGYPTWFLNRASRIVSDIARDSLMKQSKRSNKKQKDLDKSIVFTTSYSPQLNAKNLKKYMRILHTDDDMSKIRPIKYVARRAGTIGNKVEKKVA